MSTEALVERLWPIFDAAWIAYRDEDLIVIDKPAGIACQAADAAVADDLVTRLRAHLAQERHVAPADVYLGVHQRLDRDTSGLVLYALRPQANAALARQFEQRTIDKRYVAIVEPFDGPDEGRLVHVLAKGRDGRMEVVEGNVRGAARRGQRGRGGSAGHGSARGQRAESTLSLLERQGERAQLQLTLRTGRTHQLRVQLAVEGAPIVGDRLYGKVSAPRMMLHSWRLQLEHPTGGQALGVEAPVPGALTRALHSSGAGADALDLDAFDDALQHALSCRFALGRARLHDAPTTAFRLLHGSAEGAEGVAIDVYDRHAVLHLSSPGAQQCEAELVARVQALGFDGVYLKRHPRQKNELTEEAQRALCPPEPVAGGAAPQPLVIHEHGVPLGVRLGDRFSTGLFLDMRDNRRRLAVQARGRRVLNLFAYTGAFSTACLHAGAAEAVCVDSSRAALERASENVARIGATDRHRTLAMDAFEALPMLARQGARFDLIALDPPSYATTRKRRFVVTRDYTALCALALAVLSPGGSLLACVNHHRVSPGQLRRFVRSAAQTSDIDLDALRDLPGQRDFPVRPGQPPAAKQLWATRAPA